MMKRELSKLQIRAEVLAVIQRLSATVDTPREIQLKQIVKLKNIADIDGVLECLLREFTKVSYDQRQLIAQLLLELGNLNKLQTPLWNIIKDPKFVDELKDTANAILRNLGDKSDPDLYLHYLKNPQDLIDQETERMLKLASINPESQIDFLDFLFSLPPSEQINLIKSLKDDYKGEYLACIFIPALDAKPGDEVSDIIIEALGTTRIPFVLKYLEELHEITENDFRKKLIKKNINLLKLSGTKADASTTQSLPAFLENSKVFECYASPIDGIGNQGIIISRILHNSDIALFSVVVNDIQGVLDCFGFNQISQTDFERIIKKFQEGTTRISISPEYCKHRLMESERLNRLLNIPIPYEYSTWKSLSLDIECPDINIEQEAIELIDLSLINNIDKLYDIADFYCWFIEDEDHPEIADFFEENLTYFIAHIDLGVDSIEKIASYYETKVLEITPTLFDEIWKELYYNRLVNTAYLLKYNNLMDGAKLAATAAWSLSEESNVPIIENLFINKLLLKSVSESLLRFQYKIDDNIEQGKSIISRDKIENYKVLLDALYDKWQVGF